MLAAELFLSAIKDRGVSCFTGVPCSYVTTLYNALESQAWPYVSATSEGEAIAIAAGEWLAGSLGVAMCQNSGLGNMVNPLTSLATPFKIPTIVIVSRRGWPPNSDEPQHSLMGRITLATLELLDIPVDMLSGDVESVHNVLSAAIDRCAARQTSAILIDKGIFHKGPKVPPTDTGAAERPPEARPAVRNLRDGERPTRAQVISAYLELCDGRVTVASTGYTARELYALADRDCHFYMVGSMGCAAGIGVGIAHSHAVPITVLDGDGSALMKLGTFATVGRYVTGDFTHIVLNNGVHESTGGQSTNSAIVDFAAVAAACGYRSVWRCAGLAAVRQAIKESRHQPGPRLIQCDIRQGTMSDLPRPKLALPDLAARFRSHVSGLRYT